MRQKSNVYIQNRRARHDYHSLDSFVAGIQLYGTEIKSIREGHASLVDTYCMFQNSELWVKNMHIAEYAFGTYNNHSPLRDRKLLLTRKELNKLQRATREKGKTIIPFSLFINEKGLAKLNISLCEGQHSYDKRQTLREQEDKRQIDRLLKSKLRK